jgi:glycerate-2-kinase
LKTHNSYYFFKQLNSLIITGRTGTNVNDVSVVCKVE